MIPLCIHDTTISTIIKRFLFLKKKKITFSGYSYLLSNCVKLKYLEILSLKSG